MRSRRAWRPRTASRRRSPASRALRWRAIFIARTTSGCGRPAERPITSVLVVDPAEPRQRLLRRRGGDLGADVEQHQQVAQVGGEERHLVGAGDQHLLGVAIASIAASTSRARDLARRLLDVDVVGGDGGLERALVEREQRRRGLGARCAGSAVRCRWRYSSRAASWSSGKPSKPSACEKRTTVEDDVFARRASSSAVWKATSSRWSTTYCATSFWERENSSKREEM